MSEQVIRRILIPAAGFGRRVGHPPAKELFIDPSSGKPLINFALRVAEDCEAAPLVITRFDKRALIDFCVKEKIELLEISSSTEWADTLLQSEPCWGEFNIVLLPDTKFLPEDSVERLFEILERETQIGSAIFDVHDFSKWGVVHSKDNEWSIAEKPKEIPQNVAQKAWGFFGFRRESGKDLLRAIMKSEEKGSFEKIGKEVRIIALNSFVDCTR